jgi:hypothetical protein
VRKFGQIFGHRQLPEKHRTLLYSDLTSHTTHSNNTLYAKIANFLGFLVIHFWTENWEVTNSHRQTYLYKIKFPIIMDHVDIFWCINLLFLSGDTHGTYISCPSSVTSWIWCSCRASTLTFTLAAILNTISRLKATVSNKKKTVW